jgi:N6-L-threonylcarbamoyladenine synthase
MQAEIAQRRELGKSELSPTTEEWLSVTPKPTLDLIASFQSAVIDELLRHASESAERVDARTIIISGGVACNAGLRAAASRRLRWPVLFPKPVLSTDNAAMIAAAAFRKLEAGDFADMSLSAKSSMPLAS